MKRAFKNDGIGSRVALAIPLRPELLAHLYEATPFERKPIRIFHGPKPRRGGGHPVVLSDEEVLQIRRMRDWYGMTTSQIAKATGHTSIRIDSIVQYRARVHLDPGPRPRDLPPLEGV